MTEAIIYFIGFFITAFVVYVTNISDSDIFDIEPTVTALFTGVIWPVLAFFAIIAFPFALLVFIAEKSKIKIKNYKTEQKKKEENIKQIAKSIQTTLPESDIETIKAYVRKQKSLL